MGDSARARSAEVAALRVGLDLGMTHIDTAEMYGGGGAEEVIAEALKDRRRSDVFLASKVLPQNATYRGTLAAAEQSLRRLRTDYLDLYMLHWPGAHPIGETMRAMEELIAAGKIRYLGVSNFDVGELRAAMQTLSRQRIAANQVLYNLGSRGIERDLRALLRNRGHRSRRLHAVRQLAARRQRRAARAAADRRALRQDTASGCAAFSHACTEHVRDSEGN